MSEIEIKSEDAAEHRTNIDGWVCKKCSRYWGKDEHMARYCCATDFPCDCGNRREKSYACCVDCRRKSEAERWAKLYAEKAKPWDGESPLCGYHSDRYHFDLESLFDEFRDSEAEDLKEWLQDQRLVFCTPNNGRHFDLNDFLYDDLAEDDKVAGCREIEKAVNDFIASKAPFSWSADGPPVTVETLMEVLEPWLEDDREPKGAE